MDSKLRFSKTVRNYIRYRPGYPQALLSFLQKELNLDQHSAIADVGSGTGKLTELLLQNQSPVFAVEPNDPMRQAAESQLQHQPNFKSIKGSAEGTQLPDNSIDVITSGQAFHWFDVAASRAEFLRISRPDAWVVLIWNQRRHDHSAFMKAYNQFLLNYSTDYEPVNRKRANPEILSNFFGTEAYQQATFYYEQTFDLEGLKGRYLSASYAYDSAHAEHEAALNALQKIFEEHQIEGKVAMVYQTNAYYGRLFSS